jgi:Zn-dependent protease with chaperone function
MPTRPSMLGRVAVAVLLTVGFYALALVMAVGLISIPCFIWIEGGRIDLRITIACLVGASAVVVSSLPRRIPTEPPGARLTAEQQPRLFRFLNEVANATGEPMPGDVFLVPDMNAFVTQRSTLDARGARRTMGIGLPTFEVLTQAQLRAVIAHEFGHFKGGDVKLGTFLYQTRAAIQRIVTAMHQRRSFMRFPFRWYGLLFLRVTQKISRQQELAADELAIAVGGTNAHVHALERFAAMAPVHVAFWNQEVMPLVLEGFRPPLGEGLQRFLAAPAIRAKSAALLKDARENDRSDPDSTHPTLKQRIAGARALPIVAAPLAAAPAVELLEDLPELERSLLVWVLRTSTQRKLAPIAWDDVEERVLLPAWRREVEKRPVELKGATVADVPHILHAIGAAMKKAKRTEEVMRARARYQRLICAVGLAYHRAGFQLQSKLGERTDLVSGDVRRNMFIDVGALAEGKTSDQEWRSRCEADGVAGVPLLPDD